jgi:ABC-type dipeptide/oligopeptide/nickel transport system ATPase component
MIPSSEHHMHLKYIQNKITQIVSDPEKSLYSSMRIMEFMDEEIKHYEKLMTEYVDGTLNDGTN